MFSTLPSQDQLKHSQHLLTNPHQGVCSADKLAAVINQNTKSSATNTNACNYNCSPTYIYTAL
jgi:hypothetical protein